MKYFFNIFLKFKFISNKCNVTTNGDIHTTPEHKNKKKYFFF